MLHTVITISAIVALLCQWHSIYERWKRYQYCQTLIELGWDQPSEAELRDEALDEIIKELSK